MKTNIGVEKGVRQKEGFDELWARFMKWTKLKREMKIMTSSCCHSVNTSIAFIVYNVNVHDTKFGEWIWKVKYVISLLKNIDFICTICTFIIVT